MNEKSASRKDGPAADLSLEVGEFEARWRSLTESSPDYIILVGIDERIRFINRTVPDLTVDGVLGCPIAEFVPEDQVDSMRRCFERVLKSAESDGYSTQYVTADGEQRYFESRVGPVLEGGKVIGFVVTSRDTTENERTQRALVESEGRYRALIEANPDLMFRLSRHGEYLDYHAAQEDDLLLPPDAIIGTSILQSPFPDALKERLMTALLAVLEDRRPRTVEYELTMASGRRFFEARISASGPDEAITIVRDISDRKTAEAEKRRLEAQLLQVQKLESLGILAGGIAHDFNNLLTGILGNAMMAAADLPQGSQARQCLERVERTATRASELCKQMLTYAGRGKFQPKLVDLSALAGEMVEMLELSVSKRAVLTLELGQPTPLVHGDASQLRQIVLNLITNAADAVEAEGGTIVLRTGREECSGAELRGSFLHESLPPGSYAFVEIEDDGVGMDEATLEKIFDPFYTTKFTGRGLGLAAVLGILRSHRGAVSIESSPGEGTRFRVRLPAFLGTPELAEARETAQAAEAPRGQVLIVDDELAVRELAQSVLDRFGCKSRLAATGDEAVTLFNDAPHEYSVVLLDVTMPGMGGCEVLSRLRSIRPGVPVVLSSGYDEDEIDTGSETCVFLQKPYGPDELWEAICCAAEGDPPDSEQR